MLRIIAALLSFGMVAFAHASGCVHPGDSLFADNFQVASNVYYVAKNGSNVAAGSLAAPWLTVQFAASHAGAGDTVCARAGVYNEIVSVSTSGAADAPLTLQAEPGEIATIDGTGLAVPSHQWGLITLSDVGYVTIAGFEVRNYKRSTAADVPIGLYVTGAGSGIRLIGNHIHDIANTAAGCAANAFGLKVDGTHAPASIDGIVIAGNEIDHLTLGCSESFSLDGNVEHFTITANKVHDTNNIGIGAIGFEGVAPQVAYDQARDGTISDNLVYNITSFGNPAYGNQYAADGIYIDGGTRIVIERNVVHHVDLGIELASEHSGRTTSAVIARDNLIYFGNSAGISLGGYDASVGGTDQCTVVNNTLFQNDVQLTYSGELQIQYHATNNVIENNIVNTGDSGIALNAFTGDTLTPVVLDHNLYYFNSPAANWVWRGSTYLDYDTYVAMSGQDAHSLGGDPQFVDVVTPDLHVNATSRAVGAGDNLGANIIGTTDVAGHPRIVGKLDIGAYEQ